MTEYDATKYFMCHGMVCGECNYKVGSEWHSGCWLIDHFYLYDGTSKFDHKMYRILQQNEHIINRQRKTHPGLYKIICKYFGAKLG